MPVGGIGFSDPFGSISPFGSTSPFGGSGFTPTSSFFSRPDILQTLLDAFSPDVGKGFPLGGLVRIPANIATAIGGAALPGFLELVRQSQDVLTGRKLIDEASRLQLARATGELKAAGGGLLSQVGEDFSGGAAATLSRGIYDKIIDAISQQSASAAESSTAFARGFLPTAMQLMLAFLQPPLAARAQIKATKEGKP